MKRHFLPLLGLAPLLVTLACSDSTSSGPGTSATDGGSSEGGGGGGDGGGGGADGASPDGGGGTGAVTYVGGGTGVTDLVGSGETAYFTGVEGGGQSAILSATTTTAGVGVLCKAGANRVLSALAIDGTTLYAIRRDPATGDAAVVKTTTTGTGAACEDVAAISAGFLTELTKVGDSLVYLGPEKVMRLPVAGGTESELLTTGATGFVGDFAASGTTGFVVDTSTAGGPPGARLVRFTAGGAGETFVSVNSPSDSGHEIVGGKVVWAERGPTAGDFVFKTADATAPLPISPATLVTSNFGIGSLLLFCRPNAASPTELAVAAYNTEVTDYHLVGSSSQASRKLASVSSLLTPIACTLTTGAIWSIDPTDKRVFWVAR